MTKRITAMYVDGREPIGYTGATPGGDFDPLTGILHRWPVVRGGLGWTEHYGSVKEAVAALQGSRGDPMTTRRRRTT